MSDLKLIMEGWRQYSVDKQYDEALNYILKNHYDGLLTEGMVDDVKSALGSAIKRFGKRAVTGALIAAIATNALAPGVAMAADQMTAPDLPVAAQQVDASDAAATMKLPVGKAVKDIFGKGGKLDKFGKDTFGKDGKIKDLLKKKDKDVDDTPVQAATDAPEGFQQNAETGDYEFRVNTDQGHQDLVAKNDARIGLTKELVKQGLIKADPDGSVSVQGLSVNYEGDMESGQFVGKWSPERAEKAQEMLRQMQQMSR